MLTFLAKHKNELVVGLEVVKSLRGGAPTPELFHFGMDKMKKALAEPVTPQPKPTPTSLHFEEIFGIIDELDGHSIEFKKEMLSPSGWPIPLVRVRTKDVLISITNQGQEVLVVPTEFGNVVFFRKFAGRHYIGYSVSSTMASKLNIVQNGILESVPTHPLYIMLSGMVANAKTPTN